MWEQHILFNTSSCKKSWHIGATQSCMVNLLSQLSYPMVFPRVTKTWMGTFWFSPTAQTQDGDVGYMHKNQTVHRYLVSALHSNQTLTSKLIFNP